VPDAEPVSRLERDCIWDWQMSLESQHHSIVLFIFMPREPTNPHIVVVVEGLSVGVKP